MYECVYKVQATKLHKLQHFKKVVIKGRACTGKASYSAPPYLPANIRQGWKCLILKNALAYYTKAGTRGQKKFKDFFFFLKFSKKIYPEGYEKGRGWNEAPSIQTQAIRYEDVSKY